MQSDEHDDQDGQRSHPSDQLTIEGSRFEPLHQLSPGTGSSQCSADIRRYHQKNASRLVVRIESGLPRAHGEALGRIVCSIRCFVRYSDEVAVITLAYKRAATWAER